MKVGAVIVAAGSSVRFGGAVPKQFKDVCGRPLLAWTISRFEAARTISEIVVVVTEEQLAYTGQRVIEAFDFHKVSRVVTGGATRRESVYKGLRALPRATDLAAIHDGARPLISPVDIDRAVEVARNEKAVVVAIRASDTIKRARDGYVLSTLERDTLYQAQTPQVFQYDLILEAHRQAAESGEAEPFTDDAVMIEALGLKVCIVEPTSLNPKVTSREDLIVVEALLTRELHEKSENRPRS
ncbi:MAG TPA: 2-C-methyl-D-erythritol 4-phosphate cytidylyltransferase [Candidatus Deferrimicrobium sp.]|nr:2-C-methyl-D-erythritol 4-phosphate cytidylyltransferase [Candidatus Deferrimicrobium sp.]